MTLSIRGKIVCISVVIMILAMGATILVNGLAFMKEYSSALELKAFVIARTLRSQLERLLKLEIPLSSLVGFEEQCQEILTKYQEISYAMVVDIHGTILFHNDLSEHGRVLTNPAILEDIRSQQDASQVYSKDGEQFYNVTVPVRGTHGKYLAAMVLGFRIDYIAQKTRKMIVYSIEVSVFFIGLAIILLIILLNLWVSKPLSKLMAVIHDIRQRGTDSTRRVEVDSRDEIGELSAAFNQMISELRDSHEKITHDSRELEKQVEQRTAELKVTNEQLQQDIVERKRAEELLHRERDLARALEQATAALTGTLDFEQVLDRILEQVSHIIPNDTADIMFIEGEQAHIVRWRGYERFGMGEQISTLVFRVSEVHSFQHMLHSREPMLVPDVALDPDWVDVPTEEWLRSYAAVPVVVRAVVIGFLNITSATPGYFTQVHVGILRAFAEHAAAALENARLYEMAQQELAERKRAQDALDQAYQALKSTQVQLVQSAKLASIGELAAGVAHELNQPLMVIRTSVQFIRRTLEKGTMDTAQFLKLFEPVERNTKRMMNIINHLRTFSRQPQGAFSPQNINEIIENSFLMVGEQLRLHNIEVKKSLTPDIPKIQGDANQLEQVFLNLLTNARDAIEAKGAKEAGQIEIVTRVSGHDNQWVEILVTDSGDGIAADCLENVFDPFVTTKEIGKGTGLGLSISYGIIKEHQGKIEVVETSSEGTTFRVILLVEGVEKEIPYE